MAGTGDQRPDLPDASGARRHRFGCAAVSPLRPAVSVVLAVLAAHALGLHDSWWAAISAFVVVQGGFGQSLYKAVLRVAGTVLGAALGLLLGPLVAPYPVLMTALLCGATWLGLFAALVHRHSYAWVLALVMFIVIVLEALHPDADLRSAATELVSNIALGALAAVAVAGIAEIGPVGAALARDHAVPGFLTPRLGRLTDGPVDFRSAARHALQAVVAVGVLSVVVWRWDLGALAQGMATTIAVLVVPLDTHAGNPHAIVLQRMLHRFLGCLLAGLAALALLPVIGGHPILCFSALFLGVLAGTSAQARFPDAGYVAVQFTVAFIMVFVQDQGWTVDLRPALLRLAGIATGIATLYAVFLAFRFAGRRE